MMLDDREIKRRRSGPEVLDRKLVRAAIAPVVRRIDALQRECAFLNVQAMRIKRAELEPRIVSLGHEVAGAARQLDAVTAELTPEQQAHSRVIDLRRALNQLSSSVPRLV